MKRNETKRNETNKINGMLNKLARYHEYYIIYIITLFRLWSYSVMVSTQDFESCSPGSNPDTTFL
jgi:hypothetical protein